MELTEQFDIHRKHLAEDVKLLRHRAKIKHNILVKGKMSIPVKDFLRLNGTATTVRHNVLVIIRSYPEFVVNPTFRVIKSKRLDFSQKYTKLRLLPAMLGLDADKLEVGQRVRVSLKAMGINPGPYISRVKKLLVVDPPVLVAPKKRKRAPTGPAKRIHPLKDMGVRSLIWLLRKQTTTDYSEFCLSNVCIEKDYIAASNRHSSFLIEYENAFGELGEEFVPYVGESVLIDNNNGVRSGRFPSRNLLDVKENFAGETLIATVDLRQLYNTVMKAKPVWWLKSDTQEAEVLLVKNRDDSLGAVAMSNVGYKQLGKVADKVEDYVASAIINVTDDFEVIAFFNPTKLLDLLKMHMRVGEEMVEIHTDDPTKRHRMRFTTKGKISVGGIMPVHYDDPPLDYREYLSGWEFEWEKEAAEAV